MILPDIEFQLCRRDSQLGFLGDSFAFNGKPLLGWCEQMRPTIVLTAVVCWSTPCTIAAAQTQCVSFSDTIDGVNKDRAIEKSLKSLDEQIEKWKADNGVTGPVTVLARLRSIFCTTATRCRVRHCVHDLLDRCGIARG